MSHQFNLSNSEDNFESQEQEIRAEQDSTAEEESLQLRLRIIDHLLSNAPMLAPGAEFAERVMTAIRSRTSPHMNENASLGLALGLVSVVLVVMGIVTGMALGLINVVLNWTAIYQVLVSSIGEVAQALKAFFSLLTNTLSDNPLLPVLLLLAIPLFFSWLWVMRRVKPSEKNA